MSKPKPPAAPKFGIAEIIEAFGSDAEVARITGQPAATVAYWRHQGRVTKTATAEAMAKALSKAAEECAKTHAARAMLYADIAAVSIPDLVAAILDAEKPWN
jgi:hypothetical protein